MNIVGEIRSYLGDKDYAYIKYSESNHSFSIDIVSVPAAHRNQGIGGMLVRHVLVMADNMEKEVYVSARPLGNVNEDNIRRLVAFYERFGFRVYDRGLTVVYMVKKWPAAEEEDR